MTQGGQRIRNKRKHAKGFLYVLKRITKIIIKLGLRDYFIRFFSLLFYVFFKGQNNLIIIGKKNLPKKGAYLVVGNHSSTADAGLILAVLNGLFGRRFYYIAHAKDFKYDNFQRYFHMLLEGRPRIGTGASLVNYMAKKLLEGKVVVIPPEGMYNRNGKIMQGYTGVTRVYYNANYKSKVPIPIVPIVSIGADKAYPTTPDKNGKFHIYKKGIIGRIGKPFFLQKISFDELAKMGNSERYVFFRKQTDYIMNRIAELALQKEGVVESWILKGKSRGKERKYE
ncbi:MAG: lysophospholipid acyltransferase family protein [Promethearchaeota archaeon]